MSSNTLILDLSTNIGQYLIGTLIAGALWGITSMQIMFYFSTYKLDGWNFKGLVVVLWLLNTLHQILCIRGLWGYLIPKFGDPINLSTIQWEIVWQAPVTGLVATIGQSFFFWRIWRFSGKSRALILIMVPSSATQMVGTFVYAAMTVGKPQSFIQTPKMMNLVVALSTVTTLTDVLIAIIMCWVLWRGRSGFPVTDRIVMRLMHATVATCLCTAIFALLTTITAICSRETLYYALGEIPISSLYCNAVLANLNSRKYVKGGLVVGDSFSGRAVDAPISLRGVSATRSSNVTLDKSGPRGIAL